MKKEENFIVSIVGMVILILTVRRNKPYNQTQNLWFIPLKICGLSP